MKKIKISQTYSDRILAGNSAGKAYLPILLQAANEVQRGDIVLLDFSNLDLVTASFFRESFKVFRDHARQTMGAYPIFVCESKATIEEVTALAEDTGDVFIFSKKTPLSALEGVFLIGGLEEKQEHALRSLLTLGEADAKTLYDRFPETPPLTSSAAWSNRLAKLSEKGIVTESMRGKSKVFSPIAKEITYGSRFFSK
jgi:hypothetical protein